MRVALIGCTVNPRVGGMGRALYDHAVALSEAGHEVTVYTLDPGSDALRASVRDDRGVGVLQNDMFTIRVLPRLFSIGKAAWGVRFDPPLDAYDVVHLHLPFFGVSEAVARYFCHPEFISGSPNKNLEMLKQVQHDKKLVATYHMDAVGMGLKKWYFKWWYRHRFKKVLDACDAIAVTSRAYTRESQLARVGVDAEKCEEILLRVDTDVFNPSLRAPTSRGEAISSGLLRRPDKSGLLAMTDSIPSSYLLFVGALDRAHYFKGLSLLLRAFKSLDPGSPTESGSGMTEEKPVSGMTEGAGVGMTESPRLVVVGSGELLNEYKKEAAQLGIADRVHFTGGVSDEELARWYAGARALVLPSTDRSEAFGIVLIEAMACGTPAIASDLPGVREVVERVNGGVLVPVGIASPRLVGARNDNLIAALQQMWQHPWSDEDRAALATRAAAVYDRATLADQLLQWYRGIITA